MTCGAQEVRRPAALATEGQRRRRMYVISPARQVRCRFAFCYLFSFLLQWDSENEEGVGTPTLKRLQFREILDLVRKTLYRELRIDAAAPG